MYYVFVAVDPGPDPPARAGLHANGLPVNSKAPNLSFASQNLRSLNISTKNRITRDKIFAITREKQDIILLCDLKLNSNIQKAAVHDVEKYFFLNGYKLYHNSKHSTRGVGVLINRKISHSISNCLCDNDGNIIILELNLDVGNERLIVGSLYGTNQNEEGFFNTVEQFLNQLNGPPIILGGDLNATWDNQNVNDNLDVHSMQNIPSIFRTNKIRSLCNIFNLVDPFRALYPNKKDFTYVPSVVNNHNRSRIDFFMITVTLIPYVKNCSISVGLLTTHFDHKCIFLNFKKKPVARTFPIKFSILKENEVSWQVTSSVIESYIQHALLNENYTQGQKDQHLLTLGEINMLTQESLDLKLALVTVGVDNHLDLQIEAIPPQVEELFSTLPGLSFFEELERPEYCNDALFFDTLVHCVRNSALLQQKKIFNIKANRKNALISRIKTLKENYNINSREIHIAERLLNTLIENELKLEITQNKKFEVLNDEKMTAHFSCMAKVSKQECAISEICNDFEQEFASTDLRSSYIKNYFGDVYKMPPGPPLPPDSIQTFLGDTANHNTV